MATIQHQTQALIRARDGQAVVNYPAVVDGQLEKSFIEADIRFTSAGWKALGRSVKKGEHGVKVVTFVKGLIKEANPTTGRQIERCYLAPHVTTVFHILQTEDAAEQRTRLAAGKPLGSGPLDWPREKRLRRARKVRARLLRDLPQQYPP